jgi:hypothetical protein
MLIPFVVVVFQKRKILIASRLTIYDAMIEMIPAQFLQPCLAFEASRTIVYKSKLHSFTLIPLPLPSRRFFFSSTLAEE